MQQILTTLSQLLRLGGPTLTADDLAVLAADSRDVLMEQRILAPSRTATHVTCDACHEDHVEEVVRINGGKGTICFRIRCPDAGWVDVPEGRLRQWAIDVRRLVALLSVSVGSREGPEEAICGVAWRLGGVEVGSAQYELTFVLNCDTADVSILDQVAMKFPPAQTIIVGACDLSDGTACFAAALSLPSAFEFVGDRLELQVDRIRSVISAAAITRGNVFQRRGEYWQLSFQGETKFFKDSVGLGYIARLLIQPDRDIPAVTLLAARAGIDPLVASGSSGEMLDDEAREDYGQRYRDLQDDLQEATENNDLGRVEKLANEMEQLTNELATATGLGGRSREITDADRVRRSVSMAVSRDIERVAKAHEPLGRHLTSSISSGLVFRYSPERKVDWLT